MLSAFFLAQFDANVFKRHNNPVAAEESECDEGGECKEEGRETALYGHYHFQVERASQISGL